MKKKILSNLSEVGSLKVKGHTCFKLWRILLISEQTLYHSSEALHTSSKGAPNLSLTPSFVLFFYRPLLSLETGELPAQHQCKLYEYDKVTKKMD